MSDPYGIGASQKMALHLFENASRSSGRTTQMIAALREGDAIVVPDTKTAKFYERVIRDYGFERVQMGYPIGDKRDTISILTIPVKDTHRPYAGYGTNPHGQTWLTHEMYLAFYEDAIDGVSKHVNRMTEDLSKKVRTSRGDMLKELGHTYGFTRR